MGDQCRRDGWIMPKVIDCVITYCHREQLVHKLVVIIQLHFEALHTLSNKLKHKGLFIWWFYIFTVLALRGFPLIEVRVLNDSRSISTWRRQPWWQQDITLHKLSWVVSFVTSNLNLVI